MKPSHYLLLVYAILTACSAAEKKSSQISSQPDEAIEFAKPFTSVCKVGKKGGDGTLIDSNWVLTAAHVAEGSAVRALVRPQVPLRVVQASEDEIRAHESFLEIIAKASSGKCVWRALEALIPTEQAASVAAGQAS